MVFVSTDVAELLESTTSVSTASAAAPKYFNTRKTTIYGGSNEIQKNILAKMVLEL